MFKLTVGKGFHIVLRNDWTVSVQWGAGNYCENHWNQSNPFDKSNSEYGQWQSKTAEIAAMDSDGKFLPLAHGDTVLGYCTVEQVLEFISAVSELPDRKPLEAWEGKWLGTVDKHSGMHCTLEDFDHVAASIGVEPDVLRNDSG